MGRAAGVAEDQRRERWRKEGSMARPGIVPTSVERPFALDELFFSTTDRKGVIRSGNRVFTRVSGYAEQELLGEPHNIIRHPDMPRVVFQLLWEYLEARRPIAAYVKNMAQDGGYYWVLATVVGVGDGYLSVRMKPAGALLETVEALYAELRATERAVEERGGKPREAMTASRELLAQRLAQLGFADYDAFMHAALPAELGAREAALPAAARRRREAGAGGTLAPVGAACGALHGALGARFASLDGYAGLHRAFVDGFASVLRLSDDIRLFALNAQIGAARLAERGAALGEIADRMRTRSDSSAGAIREMRTEVEALVGVLGTLGFDVSLAMLQSEMAGQFVAELADGPGACEGGDGGAVLAANVAALGACLREGAGPLLVALDEVDGRLRRVAGTVAELGEELRQLDALQVAGRIETARLVDAGDFRVLFDEIRQQVAGGRDTLRGFDGLRLLRSRAGGNGTAAVVERSLAQVERWVAAAAAAA
jgi:aerotaxis receptor